MTTQFDFNGKRISPKPKRDVMSPEGRAVLERGRREVPEGIKAIWDLMAELGITPTPGEYRSVAERLSEIEDYPIDWIPSLKAKALELEVMNPLTIAKWAVATRQRGVAPGGGKEERAAVYDDAFIKRFVTEKLAAACDCDEERCVQYRESLQKVIA